MTTETDSLLDSVERTALLTAALRAAETRRPDRLYTDPYAEAFAGDAGPRLLAEIGAAMFPPDAPRTLPSTPDYNAIRTRFFDDLLTDAARTPHGQQIVIAPSGMDSRPFRLAWPDGVRVFEIDRPRVVALKQAVLDDIGATSTVDRTTVAVDLREDWEGDLVAAGYDPDTPSTWLLEGLLYYIGAADVHRVLDRVRAVTAPGSVIAADIVNVAALTALNMRGLLDVFAGWGCPWVFGCDEPEALFAQHGIDAVAIQPGDPEADYGRWPDPVPPRSVRDVRRVFFVRGVRR
jgi:methyltransferase (TIGR00027 family)